VFGTPGSGKSAPTSNNIVGSAIAPFRGTLAGSVAATGKLKLMIDGKAVTSLKTGRYTIAVTDRSPKSGFTVQESRAGATTVTGVAFVGKHSVTLTLRPGQWFFYPTFVGTKTYFLVTR